MRSGVVEVCVEVVERGSDRADQLRSEAFADACACRGDAAGVVVEDDEAGPKIKAEKPLREANIEVVEVPGKPGVYRAVAFLRPHFQLDELTIAMRLVAELPKSAK